MVFLWISYGFPISMAKDLTENTDCRIAASPVLNTWRRPMPGPDRLGRSGNGKYMFAVKL